MCFMNGLSPPPLKSKLQKDRLCVSLVDCCMPKSTQSPSQHVSSAVGMWSMREQKMAALMGHAYHHHHHHHIIIIITIIIVIIITITLHLNYYCMTSHLY